MLPNEKLRYFFAGAVVALVAAAATLAYEHKGSGLAGSHVLLAPEDYIEIQQLYGMYARDVDPGSVRNASWMFTKDAVVVMGNFKTLTNHDDITAFYDWVRQRQTAGVRHFNSSYVIVGTPDGDARGSSYMISLEKKMEGGPIEVVGFGKYEDKLVKTSEGWRIKERVWQDDTFRGSTAQVTASPVPGDRQTDPTGAQAAAAAAQPKKRLQ